MLDNIIDEIINLKWVVVIYSIIIILVCGLIWLSTKDFAWVRKKTTPFAILYNLNKKQVITFALILGRLCFVLTSAIFCKYINLGYLAVLFMFSLIILFLTKDIESFITSILNCFAIFVLLYLQNSLYNYYLNIERLGIVVVMLIMIGIFAVLYTALQSISSYERLLENK